MKESFKSDTGIIYQGHVLHILRTMQAESVQCCVTSPPYWGLRDYKIEPQIWDDDKLFTDGLRLLDCPHEWVEQVKPGITGGRNQGEKVDDSDGCTFRPVPDSVSAFCLRCGAWRGSLGLEPTPELFVKHIVDIFREMRRVLKPTGTLFLNLGDSYSGSGKGDGGHTRKQTTNAGSQFQSNLQGCVPPGLKPKDLCGIPWRVAFALQADGWWLRSDIIWSKPNPMPESVTDRPTKAHEYIFLLTKSQKYYFDQDAVREPVAPSTIGRGLVDFGGEKGRNYNPEPTDPNYRGGNEQWGRTFDYRESCKHGRNIRSVWTIATQPFQLAHFATFPEAIPERCIKAGTSEKGCCPKCGSPWERVTETEIIRRKRPNAFCSYREINGQPDQTKAGVNVKTLGWRPTCSCDAGEPVPCVVLDPFFGAGTVGLVAEKLNRKWIGIELNPEYCDMAEKRILGKCWNVEEGQANWLQDKFQFGGQDI